MVFYIWLSKSINSNLNFDELVYESKPTSILEAKTINISRLINNSFSHYFEKSEYNQPLFLVRKIEGDNVLIEEEEFAFAA